MNVAILSALLLISGSVLASDAPASSTNDLVAQARAYEHGEGVPRNGEKAVSLYCEASRAGDAEAQYSLGWMLANGRGVPRDDAQAAFFFSLAAAQQHAQAQRMLRFVGAPASAQPPCMKPPQASAPEVAPEEEFDSTPPASSPAQRRVWALVNRLAPEYGVHPRLAMAVIRAESNFDPAAVSPKNAQGLMQLIPETSARFNVTKPFDPEQNIRGGLAYLRWLLAYFKGQVPLVAAAYNAGEGAVNRYRGIPPFAETQGYVRRIVQLFKRHYHPFDARIAEPSPELPRMRVTSM